MLSSTSRGARRRMTLPRTALVLAVLAASVLATAPRAAQARPCSDLNPVVIRGQQWIVYTGDSPWELENLSCKQARTIATRMIRHKRGTRGWRCVARRFTCVRGGRYTNEYGHRMWRYQVGWHGAD